MRNFVTFEEEMRAISRQSDRQYRAAECRWNNHIKNGNTGRNKKTVKPVGKSL
jgi:hypothetical protein